MIDVPVVERAAADLRRHRFGEEMLFGPRTAVQLLDAADHLGKIPEGRRP